MGMGRCGPGHRARAQARQGAQAQDGDAGLQYSRYSTAINSSAAYERLLVLEGLEQRFFAFTKPPEIPLAEAPCELMHR